MQYIIIIETNKIELIIILPTYEYEIRPVDVEITRLKTHVNSSTQILINQNLSFNLSRLTKCRDWSYSGTYPWVEFVRHHWTGPNAWHLCFNVRQSHKSHGSRLYHWGLRLKILVFSHKVTLKSPMRKFAFPFLFFETNF